MIEKITCHRGSKRGRNSEEHKVFVIFLAYMLFLLYLCTLFCARTYIKMTRVYTHKEQKRNKN